MTPGEAELAEAELRRARRALEDARSLIATGGAESAASRLYYAAFHATRAALTVRGLHSKTHSGQIALFTETFGAIPILGKLLRLRTEADYALGESRLSVGDLRDVLQDTESFVERCASLASEVIDRGPDEPDPAPDQ